MIIDKFYTRLFLDCIKLDVKIVKSQKFPKHDELNSLCNIAYGDNKDKVFDVHFPKNTSQPIPAIFHFHGGGYVGGDRVVYDEYCKLLADQGYIVFNIDYEACLKKGFPTPIYNAFEFFKFLEKSDFANKIDYDNIFLSGDSAGGHIAMLIANIQTNKELKEKFKLVDGPNIKGLILINPMMGLYKFNGLWPKNQFANLVYKENKDSEITKVCHNLELDCKNLPPCLIVSANNDIVKLHANIFEKRAKKEQLYLEHYTIMTGLHLRHNGLIMYPYDKEHLYCLNKIHRFIENVKNNKLENKVISKKVSFTNIKKNTSYEELTLK